MKKNIIKCLALSAYSLVLAGIINALWIKGGLLGFAECAVIGITWTLAQEIFSDILEKAQYYPELLSWIYFGGVAIEYLAVALGFSVFYAPSLLIAIFFALACIAACVGIYFYDKYVYDIRIFRNREARRQKLENNQLKIFLNKISKNATEATIVDALKKWCRFNFIQNDIEAGFDFSNPLDENWRTYKEMSQDASKIKDEAELATANAQLSTIENIFKIVANYYLENHVSKEDK